jgi:hypothetical protein
MTAFQVTRTLSVNVSSLALTPPGTEGGVPPPVPAYT